VIHVGYSANPASETAGRECVGAALAGGPGTDLSGVMAFCGGKHDPAAFLRGLRSLTNAPVFGGSAAGCISRDGSGYSGLESAVVGFPGELGALELLVDGTLDAGERQAGQRLGERLAASADGRVVMLFYDSVAAVSPHRLHPASLLIEGIRDALGGRDLMLFGGGMLTDLNLSGGYVFDGDAPRKHAAVAVVLPPTIVADTAILHGCVPVSSFLKVTRIDGAELLELDGRPALEVLEERLAAAGWSGGERELSLSVTLGQKLGDAFAPYDENSYVNRLILKTDRERRSVTLFEPDYREGSLVQIMSRDNSLMIESVRRGTAALVARSAARSTLLWLYIDCAGRASARSGAEVEEAEILLKALPPATPMIGFYSGVEIAPVAGSSRPLDWTGVLASLYRRES
jgi:hypothetical protein